MLNSVGVGFLPLGRAPPASARPVPQSRTNRHTVQTSVRKRGLESSAVGSSGARSLAGAGVSAPGTHVVALFEARPAKGPLEVGLALASRRHPTLIRVAQFEDTVDFAQTCRFLECFPPSQVVVAKSSEASHLVQCVKEYITSEEDTSGVQLIAGKLHSKRVRR
jgi:hypothetical protein